MREGKEEQPNQNAGALFPLLNSWLAGFYLCFLGPWRASWWSRTYIELSYMHKLPSSYWQARRSLHPCCCFLKYYQNNSNINWLWEEFQRPSSSSISPAWRQEHLLMAEDRCPTESDLQSKRAPSAFDCKRIHTLKGRANKRPLTCSMSNELQEIKRLADS